MATGIGMKTEFDEVRHGYAPRREQNRSNPIPVVPASDDVAMRWPAEDWTQSGDAEEETPWTHPGIGATVSQLTDKAKAAAMAELSLVKTRATVAADAAKGAAIFGAAAAVLALVLLMALAVGLILTLAEQFGPLTATLIIAGALAVLAVVTAMVARGRAGRVAQAIKD